MMDFLNAELIITSNEDVIILEAFQISMKSKQLKNI